MKKLSFILATALFCGFAFTSCSDDDDVVSGGTVSVADTATPSSEMIQFNAPFLGTQTRAVTSDNFTDYDAYVQVCRTATSSTEYSSSDALESAACVSQTTLTLDYNGSIWEPSLETPWYNQYGFKFYAVMPSLTRGLMSFNSDYSVCTLSHLGISYDDDESDYLYAYTTRYWEAGDDPTVSLNFYHIHNNVKLHYNTPTGDYKVNVTSAGLYIPNFATTWDSENGFTSSNSVYSTELTVQSDISSNYKLLSLPTGYAGETDDSGNFLLAGLSGGVYLYLYMEYNIEDANGNVIMPYTVEYMPIYLSSDVATVGTLNNPTKDITININIDTTAGDGTDGTKVTNISYNVNHVDRETTTQDVAV